jgi:hypothetical protein
MSSNCWDRRVKNQPGPHTHYAACVAEFASNGIKAARSARCGPGSPAAPLTAARPFTLWPDVARL